MVFKYSRIGPTATLGGELQIMAALAGGQQSSVSDIERVD
jgi:hypothetical protein